MATYSIPAGQNKFIFIFAGLMLAAAACWYGYRLLDGSFLSEREAVGKVVGKEHVPMSQKQTMQNIGGHIRPVSITVPETWLLDLDLDGARARASVDPDEFARIGSGDRVKVRIVKRRLSGNLRVTEYLGKQNN
jgi:hypothetical protein